MPGPEDLTQRLLWPGAPQPLCAGAEESDASAEIDGTAPKRSRPGPGQSLPPAQAGIRLSPQACPPADAVCEDRLCEMPGLQSHHQLPAQPPPRPQSKEISFLSNQIRPGWMISPAFPPERAGSIRPSSRACVPAKGWAKPFPVLIDTTLTLEALDRAVRRLRQHERASPRMSRVHSAFPGVLRPFFREGLKDKTLRHFHSCERALKPCSDSF